MNNLKSLRKEKRMTQSEMAKILNISQNSYSYWENDKVKIDNKSLERLSAFFNVTVDYILGREETNIKKKGVKIPVLGKVVAGIPVEASEEIIDYEEITEEMSKQGEFFALQINGDSMRPKFDIGDVVIVRKQSNVDTGDIAIVLVNGDEATIKKVKKSEDGIMLIPTNQDYSPMFFTNKEILELPVTIIGKVVELRAKF